MATETHNTGVRWSGMSDEPTRTPSAEAQARAQAAYLKALEAAERRIAERAKLMGLRQPGKAA